MSIETRSFGEYDPINQIERKFHYDHNTDVFHIETIQHGSEALELAKASFNGFDERAPWKGDGFHHVAHIPPVVVEMLRKQRILDDPKRLKKWLNDRDNRMFRTRPGRV